MKQPTSHPLRAVALSVMSTLAAMTSVASDPAHAATPAATPEPASTLTPPANRISDEAIQADYRSYEAMQARIKALNDKGRRVADYGLAKAQCWLDVSFHEYTRNDRSAFPQDALGEAGRLLRAMESGLSLVAMDTPLVNGAAKLRLDLWALTDALKREAGFACAQQKIACAEVELVHAGNEMNQQGWRHAQPYIQIAEDLVTQARTLQATCAVATAVPMPAPAPMAVAAAAAAPEPNPAPRIAPPAVQAVRLQTNVLFAFDRAGERDVLPDALPSLRALVSRIASGDVTGVGIELVGHADRLNRTGDADYNRLLSQRRVATVRSMLMQMGVDPAIIASRARGDAEQVEPCSSKTPARSAALENCLLPNRRVQVIVTGSAR